MDQIYPGLEHKWLEDHQIAAYRVESLSIDVMMEWSNHVMKTLKSWKPDGFYLFLFDISHQGVGSSYLVMTGRDLFNVGITRAGRTQVDQFMHQLQKENPGVGIRVAVIASPDPSGQLIRRYSGTGRLDAVMGKLFFQYHDAIRWLLDQNNPVIESQTRELKIRLQNMVNQLKTEIDAPPPPKREELVLLINGAVERIKLNGRTAITIGRISQNTQQQTVDLDLSWYGEPAASVSRRHARLLLDGNNIMIMDLGSTNGTYVSGELLTPHQARRVTRDDLIRLGYVSLSILM